MAESDVQTRASLSKLRQREAELDARASLIDTRTDLEFSEVLEIAARGMFFTRHFMGRFLTKNLLMFFAITVPVTIMPWPIKIVIDHVVLGTPIDYGVLLFYFKWIRGPTRSMGLMWAELQYHAAGLRRVFALMDMPGEEDLGHRVLQRVDHGVEFRDVGLVYPDGRRALAGVSLTADIGQIVAIAGPTGAGKTSLASLIPRYPVATEGEVLIDGANVNHATLASLRGQVTYVFQETQLFGDSIQDNIRFGKPNASAEEVKRVARIAGAHDFISILPQGYETRLGTSMSKLSVGQKQRIAIARGLRRDSRILILDEPMSALDPETEEYLVQSLREAARNRLVIVIAHRLSTIAGADKIVFLEEGQLCEAGSHDELMTVPDGHYRRFVELQTVAVQDH